jgi:protein ImuB
LPEYADRLVSAASRPEAWPQPEAGEPPLRPLFLFEPPQPVTVLAEVPDGPPRRFGWQGRQHRVVRQEGPERIAYPWWKTVEATGPTRDYYRIEDEEGCRFWLFRHGLYGSEKADPRWYLHGVFA